MKWERSLNGSWHQSICSPCRLRHYWWCFNIRVYWNRKVCICSTADILRTYSSMQHGVFQRGVCSHIQVPYIPVFRTLLRFRLLVNHIEWALQIALIYLEHAKCGEFDNREGHQRFYWLLIGVHYLVPQHPTPKYPQGCYNTPSCSLERVVQTSFWYLVSVFFAGDVDQIDCWNSFAHVRTGVKIFVSVVDGI